MEDTLKLNIKSLRIASAISIITGAWSLIFEIYYFRDFSLDIYFARVLFTIIALSIFSLTFRNPGHNLTTAMIHTLVISLIGSFIYTIYKIPQTIYLNSQILSLLIFTTALVFSWELKHQIYVAIYYNILFAASILFNKAGVYLLPNIFAITIFVCLISMLSIVASAVNYKLRRMYRAKADEINFIFNNVPVGICRTELTGKIITRNKFFSSLFNLDETNEELNISELVGDKEFSAFIQGVSFSPVKTKDFSVKSKNREGEAKYFWISSTRQHDDKGKFYLDFIIKDETKEIMAEKEKEAAALRLVEETRERERMATLALAEKNHRIELLAKINHEIRTPLNSIILFLDMMDENIIISMDDIKKYSRTMKISAQSLLNTINNFIDFAKIGTGAFKTEFELFDLKQEMEGIFRILQPLAKSHSDELEFTAGIMDRNVVFSDPVIIRQIMINMVANSIKFTHDGTVNLEYSNCTVADGDYEMTFVIKDTGYGIPEDKLKSIYDPFATSKKGDIMQHSSGLGLTICKEFIDMLKGRIKVESKVGVGTAFTIIIPYSYKYSIEQE